MHASEQWLRTALDREPTNAVANFNLGLAVANAAISARRESLLRAPWPPIPHGEAAFNRRPRRTARPRCRPGM
jgi:alpha/beta superfamily hydrolase